MSKFRGAIERLTRVTAAGPGEKDRELDAARETDLDIGLDQAWRAGQREAGIKPGEGQVGYRQSRGNRGSHHG